MIAAKSNESVLNDDGTPVFVAQVAIGKGWRTLERSGRLVIGGGRLTLTKRTGAVIVEAPVSEVRAEPIRMASGASAKLFMADEKYSVRPLTVDSYAVDRAVGSAMSLAGDVAFGSATRLVADLSELKQGRNMTEALIMAVRAERRRLAGQRRG